MRFDTGWYDGGRGPHPGPGGRAGSGGPRRGVPRGGGPQTPPRPSGFGGPGPDVRHGGPEAFTRGMGDAFGGMGDAMGGIGDALGGLGDALGGAMDAMGGAFNSPEFRDASRQLGRMAEDVTRGIGQGLGQSLGRGLGQMGRQMMNAGQDMVNRSTPVDPNDKYLLPAPSMTRQYVRAGLCWWFGACFGIAALGLLSEGVHALFYALVSAAIAVPLVLRALKATQEIRLGRAFRACRPVLLSQPAITVERLAQAIGSQADKLRGQLKEFIARSWIPEGHLSEDGVEFLLTDKLYSEYQEAAKEAQRKAASAKTLTPEQTQALEEIALGVARIAKAVEGLAGEAHDKFDRTHTLASQIGAEARKHPETISKLGMFTSYYLPTTAKLAEAYAEIQAKPHASADEQAAAQRILASLDDVNKAYEKLLDSMSASRTLDIETDLTAMKSMMRQDGLAE